MVHEMIDGTYRQTNLTNESPEYLAKREELRKAEIDLMRQRERSRTFAGVSTRVQRSRTMCSGKARRNSTGETHRSGQCA